MEILWTVLLDFILVASCLVIKVEPLKTVHLVEL